MDLDNQLTRLQWIFSRKDHGELYFKKIVKNISEKLKFDPYKLIQTNSSKLIKLQNDLSSLETGKKNERDTIKFMKRILV